MSSSVYEEILASYETLDAFLKTEPDEQQIKELLHALLHQSFDFTSLAKESRRFMTYLTLIFLFKFNGDASTQPSMMLNRLQEASPRQVLFL